MPHRRQDIDRARQEHDQYIDPEKPTRELDDVFVRSRAEDRSIGFRLIYWLEKFSPFWIPLSIILAALGFTIVTPKRTSSELASRIDTNAAVAAREARRLQVEIDALRQSTEVLQQRHDEIQSEFSILIRLGCADPFVSRRDKAIAGLLDNHGNCIR